jgi:sec-independent protein translocase protein TatB
VFDIGFWEIIFVATIALLVLGPERLPGAIRSAAKTFNSVKQTFNSVKSDINHELRVQELHEQLKQAEAKGMQNLTSAEQSAVNELQQAADAVNSLASNSKTSLHDVTQKNDN